MLEFESYRATATCQSGDMNTVTVEKHGDTEGDGLFGFSVSVVRETDPVEGREAPDLIIHPHDAIALGNWLIFEGKRMLE